MHLPVDVDLDSLSYSILVNVLCSFMQVKLCHCCNSHSFPLHFPFISLPLLHLFSSCSFLPHTLTTVTFLRYFDTFCQVCFCYLRVGCHAMLRTTKKKKRKMHILFWYLCYFNNTTKRKKTRNITKNSRLLWIYSTFLMLR